MELARFLESVRVDLWSVRKLGVRRVQQALLSLSKYNMAGEFIPMMRECLKASKRDTDLIDYLKVIDLLLENGIFNQLLHSSLIQFYPTIVSYLLSNGYKREVEEAKVIRKYWVGRIHPKLYMDLKEVTFRRTGIDVDQLLNSDAIFDIQHYYSKVLGLPPQEIYFHLPQLPQASIFGQRQPSLTANQQQLGNNSKYQRQQSLQKRNSLDQNIPSSSSNDLILNTKSQYQKKPLPDFSIGKRVRYCSQETSPSDSVDRFDCPRKIPPKKIDESKISYHYHGNKQEKEVKQVQLPNHYEKSLPEATEMLEKLSILFPVECQECGLRFDLPEQLKEHKENHVKDKLKAFQDKQAKKMGTYPSNKFINLTSLKEWSLEKMDLKEISKQFVLLDNISDSNEFDLNCPLCGQAFDCRFINDEWRLSNAISALVSVPRDLDVPVDSYQKLYMHATCSKMIIKDKNSIRNWSVKLA